MKTHRYPTLLAIALIALIAGLGNASPSQAAACGRVSIDNGGHGGEEGAYALRTHNLDCKAARRVVRKYLRKGGAFGHWAVRTNPHSFLLYNGSKQVKFRVAS